MSDRAIIEAVQKLAGTSLSDNIYLIPATVLSVDPETRTCECEPIGGNAVTNLSGVQLMAEVDDGILLLPAIDSTVIVCYSTRNKPYVALFSAIQKVLLVATEGIQLQGGELGGLVIAKALTDQLNKLENAFNQLNTKVNTLAPSPVIPPLVPTNLTDIENTAITQGGV